MADANTIERENLEELNQERSSRQADNKNSKLRSDSKPNIVVYAIMATIGGIGDLLGFIPVIGWFLRLPFSLVIWFWRVCTGKLKNPAQKILKNATLGVTPLPSNTTFIISSYVEETELGQKLTGMAKKANIKI